MFFKIISTLLLSFSAFACGVSSTYKNGSAIEKNIDTLSDKSLPTGTLKTNLSKNDNTSDSVYYSALSTTDTDDPAYVAPYSVNTNGRYYYFNDFFGLYATTSGQNYSSDFYTSDALNQSYAYINNARLCFDFSSIKDTYSQVYFRAKVVYYSVNSSTMGQEITAYRYLETNVLDMSSAKDLVSTNGGFYISTSISNTAVATFYIFDGSDFNFLTGYGYYIEYQLSYTSDFSTIERSFNTKQLYNYITNADNYSQVVSSSTGFFSPSYSVGYEYYKKYSYVYPRSLNINVTSSEFLTDKFKITATLPKAPTTFNTSLSVYYYGGVFLNNRSAFNNPAPLATSFNYFIYSDFGSEVVFEFPYVSDLTDGTEYIVCLMIGTNLAADNMYYGTAWDEKISILVTSYTSTGFTMSIPEQVDYQLKSPQIEVLENNYSYYEIKVTNLNSVACELFINDVSKGFLYAYGDDNDWQTILVDWGLSESSTSLVIKLTADGWTEVSSTCQLSRPVASSILQPTITTQTITYDYIILEITNKNAARVYLYVNDSVVSEIAANSSIMYSYNWLSNQSSYLLKLMFSDYNDITLVSSIINLDFTRPSYSGGVDVVDIPGLMFYIVSLPFMFFSGAFDLTLFAGTAYAVNVSDIILCVLGLLILIFIVKLVVKIIRMVI